MSATTTLKRTQVLPLHEPPDIYAVLSRLEIGQQVPANVLICDYTNGVIPPWTVREIQKGGGELLILTVCDESEPHQDKQEQATLWDVTPDYWPARDVFTLSTKTLAGPLYGWHPGCVHARDMLADIRQHARQIVDRATKAGRRAAA